jgi:ArsR family transcriptional regulator, arsenate/arsenite/antimonite-responsive transcriptional repressor
MARELTSLERLFKALADTTRLRILGLLLTGEVCVCHIHESLRIPQPKASRHLAYLRRAGLVVTRRDGVWMHYRLAEPADATSATIRDVVSTALRRVGAVEDDLVRLQKRTGCCLPPVHPLTLASLEPPQKLNENKRSMPALSTLRKREAETIDPASENVARMRNSRDR